jgi:uncharacterized hydrophobic protein (TIGR00271 family)
VLQLRITCTRDLTDEVVAALNADASVSTITVHRGAAIKPVGDVVHADVAREGADPLVHRMFDLGVQREGAIHIDPVRTWISKPAYDAERVAPGRSADAVVWPDVIQRSYEDSELTWTYLSFMVLATLLASVAIVLDSQILVIGAMILGPEFGAIAALGVALVRRRRALFRFATRTLLVGFAVAIAVATIAALVGRWLGWITEQQVTGPRPLTSFIYTPDKWSLIVAIIAAAAGVLSTTSAKIGGLSGVFVSVTTIPAAGNLALGLAFGVSSEIRGSALQLVINLTAMALAGWATLALQSAVWKRTSGRRTRFPQDPRTGPADAPLT